ncbi:hypothetical protein TRICHSKD4_2315 [Roseibium sp. TrichSKD4]|uniref:hypothetical protein n=1 Tax=Roseibium sp. TrichSKD4 TaxID=744980 RepID=UPI0001E569D1|nr:hypothetical protein [Roseibium sp. TrichSKD4]EFO32516.1 hypothetical protein TRICHSKD4_2315 [Roseibium sp. TrichSKD4]
MAFRGEGFVSRIIRHVTGGRHTHVGIAWVFRERVFLLEAREGRGVQIRALSTCLPCDWLHCDLTWTERAETAALSKLGKPYSYVDALRVGMGIAPANSGYICSEFAARVQAHITARIPYFPAHTPTSLVQSWLDQDVPLVALKED